VSALEGTATVGAAGTESSPELQAKVANRTITNIAPANPLFEIKFRIYYLRQPVRIVSLLKNKQGSHLKTPYYKIHIAG
jgi:hypothetical protein